MRALIYSNLLIAASAALITHETYLLLGVEPSWNPLLALVFCATLLVYSLDRLADASAEDSVDATERHRWIGRHRGLLWGESVLAAFGVAAASAFVSTDVLLGLMPLGVAALAYSLPLVWGPTGPYRLKDVAGLKIFVITFVWAGATALLPALQADDVALDWRVAATMAERALFIFALTLPFDIRDMARDRASEIRTIPLMIGPVRTRRLALGLTAAFAAAVVAHYGAVLQAPTLPLTASAIATFLLLFRAAPDRHELYFVGALDGMIALQWALVWGWHRLAG